MKSAPVHPRSIDTSAILFAVLVLCALAGIYCAIRFGSARGVERALITLRERPDDPQPRYLSVLIPPDPNRASNKTKPVREQSHPAPEQPSKVQDTGRGRERPARLDGQSSASNSDGFRSA